MLVESFSRTRWLDKHWYSFFLKKNSHASSLCSGPCQSFSIVPREIHNLCVSSLRQSGAIFHRIVVKKLQERAAPLILLRRIEKKKKNIPDLPTMPNASNPWRVISKKTGAMLLFFQKKVCTCHPCTKGHAKFLCAKKKKVQLTPCRRQNRHSCEGSPILCGRLFLDFRTFGRTVEGSSDSPLTNTMGGLSGCRRGSDTSGVCSTPSLIISRLRARALALDLGCGTCCPTFVMRKACTIEGSSTPRRKSQGHV